MNLTTLQTDTLRLSNTVLSQYSADNIKSSLNIYYDEVVAYIWSIDNSWNFDEGVDYLPVATTNLAKDQADYQIPSTARKIFRVTILDAGGKQRRLKPLSDKQMPSMTETGQTHSYKLVGRSIILTPTPTYNATDGVIIEMSKSVTPLDSGTDEPKIDREFHRYLSYGATKDWYFTKSNITKKREIDREMKKMKIAIRDFYTKRHRDYEPGQIRRHIENYK